MPKKTPTKAPSKPATMVRVRWPGQHPFLLTVPQRRVAATLTEAFLDTDSGEVSEKELVKLAKLPGAKTLAAVFEGSRALGVLIVPGTRKGTWRMAPLPDEVAG